MNQTTALAEKPAPQTKVKVGADGDGQDLTLLSVQAALDKPGLERIESVVRVPADYQYAIGRWVHPNDVTDHDVVLRRGSSMVEIADKVGLTIDGYDYLNRVLGISFFLPEYVHDEADNVRRNPIHRKDYIYLRLAAVWYTPFGQLVYASEDVEVDFRLSYMESRVTAKSAKPLMEGGQVQWDAAGNPLLALSPEDEMKALKTFSTQRNFGPRYAQSVARVRLMKMATGIRSLPVTAPFDGYPLKMVGWRDQLTAQARIQAVTADVANLYGKPDESKPMSAEEMAEAGATGVVEETDIDREAVERAREGQAEAVATAGQAEAVATAPVEEDGPEGQGVDDRSHVEHAAQQGTMALDDPDLPPMR